MAAAMQRHQCGYSAIWATIRATIRARHACGQCRASRWPAAGTHSLISSLQALRMGQTAAANAGQRRGGRAHTRCFWKSGAKCSAPAARIWHHQEPYDRTTGVDRDLGAYLHGFFSKGYGVNALERGDLYLLE